MNFLFNNHNFLLPDPVPEDGELVVTLERLSAIRLPEQTSKTQFQYKHSIKKLLFFMLHEGFLATVRKVFYGGGLFNMILRKRKVYAFYAINEETQQRFVGVTATSATQINKAAVPAAFVRSLPSEVSVENGIAAVVKLMSEHPDWVEEVFRYSPFAQLPVHTDFTQLKFDIPTQSDIVITAVEQCGTPPYNTRHHGTHGSMELFLVGAGVYAGGFSLPNLHHFKHFMIIDHDPVKAGMGQKLFRFEYVDTNTKRGVQRLVECKNPALCIASYHSTHWNIAKQALQVNPKTHIFIEKPPVTAYQELNELWKMRQNGSDIEIGFNRRYTAAFHRALHWIQKADGPVSIAILIKELNIPDFHWYYWPNQKTRVTGNLCHWIDIAHAFIHSKPCKINVIPHEGSRPGNEIDVVIQYENRSKINLHSTDSGDSLRGVQEYIDIRRGQHTAVINDFMSVTLLGNGKAHTTRYWYRRKGHAEMYQSFSQRRNCSVMATYPNEDLLPVAVAYLSVSEMCLHNVQEAAIEWHGNDYDIFFEKQGNKELFYSSGGQNESL